MKVVINEELCTGCGLCMDSCSEVFEMGDTIVYVKMDNVPTELEGCCREAIENCPMEAITTE